MTHPHPYDGTRRRRPGLVLLALLLLPLVELTGLVLLGRAIGAWPTVGVVLASAVVGAWLVRREGRRAWAALREATASGRLRGRELSDAGLVMAGGLLLIVPGLLTDLVGLLLVLPLTRPLVRRAVGGLAVGRVVAQGGMTRGPRPGGQRPSGRDDVVRGEVVDPDDTRA